MKMTKFQGELTDIPAKKEPLALALCKVSNVAVLAEIPLRSPQKLFICIIKKYICWVKVSKNKII